MVSYIQRRHIIRRRSSTKKQWSSGFYPFLFYGVSQTSDRPWPWEHMTSTDTVKKGTGHNATKVNHKGGFPLIIYEDCAVGISYWEVKIDQFTQIG